MKNAIGVALAIVLSAASELRADDAIAELRERYPTVRVYSAGRHFTYFFGALVTAGSTEAAAASAFLAEHGRRLAVCH